MIKYIIGLCFCLVGLSTFAQEFDFDVTVEATGQMQVNSKESLQDLKLQLENLINTTQWTDRISLQPEQKIKGSINLTIQNDAENFYFEGKLFIQAFRPIFGSNKETLLLSHIDPVVKFTFDPSRAVQFTENIFTDNLSSVIAFYMQMILALDGDSFALYGGDNYLQKARDIYNLVPTTQKTRGSQSEWEDGRNNNRSDLLNKYSSPRARPFRKAIYEYHRKGLDAMYNDVNAGKAKMLASLKLIEEVNTDLSNPMISTVFANTKSGEINSVFAIADRTMKTETYRIMTTLDPTNRQKYSALRR